MPAIFMQGNQKVARVILILLIIAFGGVRVEAGSKIGAHLIYMVPFGTVAKDVSRPGWGLGGDFVISLPNARNIISGVVGIEYINLLSRTVESEVAVEGVPLRYKKDTDQWYGRLHVGAQVGGLGNGFLRPFGSLNAAFVLYAINTDLIFEPSSSSEEEITEHKYDDIDAVFGYDLTLGLDLNFSENCSVEGGVKYLKSFSVPDQLGEGSVKIFPQYFQIFIGIGVPIYF